MSLFGKKKEKERDENTSDKKGEMDTGIKVLGSGCSKCNQLEAETVDALKELGMDETVHHVTDYLQIASYGVMSTPALVIDGKVVSYGKVLKKDEIIAILKEKRG